MTDFISPPEPTAECKEQVAPSGLPARFAKDLLRAQVSAVPIQLSFYFPLKPKKKPIDWVLDRLSEKSLLSVVDDVRDRAMILVLLRTGMRIGELLGTRVNDVNLGERKITIWEAEKNLVGRVVCISDSAKCWYAP